MLRNRISHWCCSKFADFVRGEKKPLALEWEKWEEWHEEAKKRRPIRHWLAEEGLRKIQNILMFPSDVYHSIKSYVRNRWIDKIHCLNTGLKPGSYYDLDHRILHGLFNELVIFVEMELASLSKWDETKKFKFKNGRSVDAAYDYFEWASNLKDEVDGRSKPSRQAKAAQKIQKLYEWWTIDRPNRPDPHIVSGYQKIYEDFDDIFKSKRTKKHKACLEKLVDIEQKYEDEDTKMLVELIKIRNNLWV
jgi:hypothetical protein